MAGTSDGRFGCLSIASRLGRPISGAEIAIEEAEHVGIEALGIGLHLSIGGDIGGGDALAEGERDPQPVERELIGIEAVDPATDGAMPLELPVGLVLGTHLLLVGGHNLVEPGLSAGASQLQLCPATFHQRLAEGIG